MRLCWSPPWPPPNTVTAIPRKSLRRSMGCRRWCRANESDRSLLCPHVGVPIVFRRVQSFFDTPRRDPPLQIENRTRLIVRAAGPASSERLLAYHRAGRLVIHIVVPRRVAKRPIGLGDGAPVPGKYC